MVRAVVFDFYGTLAQDAPGHGLDERLVDLGYSWDFAIEATMAGDGDDHPHAAESRDAYEAFRRPGRVAMLEAMGVPAAEVESVYEAVYGRVVPRVAYPDVVPVLDQLRAEGYLLAVCSNWDWDLDRALESSGLAGRFDVEVTSARVGCRKPHPRIFQTTLDLLEVDTADAVYVGDTPHADVDGPLAIGLRPIHVWRWHPRPRPSLPAGVPSLDDLTPLSDLLRSA